MWYLPLLQTTVITDVDFAPPGAGGTQTDLLKVLLSGSTTTVPTTVQVSTADIGLVVVAVLVFMAVIWTIRKMILLANRS